MDYMKKIVVFIFIAALTATGANQTSAAQAGSPRQVPGLTAKDLYPNGCVDCHLAGKDADMRMSSLMAKWVTAVPEPLLAKARAASPAALASKIKGKHPVMPNVKANTPQTCLGCHKKGSTIAPPFAQLMHTVHLVGGAQNKFMTTNSGECTHCHKLDQKTGTWKIATAPEK